MRIRSGELPPLPPPPPKDKLADQRVKGVQIYRPFVYGSIATPIDPANRPAGTHPDHTHQWSVYVKGVNDEDISYWLKKVQFKLHETYTNSTRLLDSPPFSISETGWGEFDVQLKLFFSPISGEKAATLWHGLKLHPFGPDAETIRQTRGDVVSQVYEEVIFNEPVEAFFDVMTSGPPPASIGGKGSKGRKSGGKAGGAGGASKANGMGGGRTAEIPLAGSSTNVFSQQQEGREIDILREAMKKVEMLVEEERGKLKGREEVMEGLKKEAESNGGGEGASGSGGGNGHAGGDG